MNGKAWVSGRMSAGVGMGRAVARTLDWPGMGWDSGGGGGGGDAFTVFSEGFVPGAWTHPGPPPNSRVPEEPRGRQDPGWDQSVED